MHVPYSRVDTFLTLVRLIRIDLQEHDWDPSNGTDIGTELRYACLIPGKTVVHVPSGNVSAVLLSTCLFNGRWDRDMDEHACTVCPKPGSIAEFSE